MWICQEHLSSSSSRTKTDVRTPDSKYCILPCEHFFFFFWLSESGLHISTQLDSAFALATRPDIKMSKRVVL